MSQLTRRKKRHNKSIDELVVKERIKLGLIFTYSEKWIGGTYYILNLIHALNTLKDESKPNIQILCKSDKEFEKVKETGYPYLDKYIMTDNPKVINYFNKAWRYIFKKNLLGNRLPKELLDVIFPANQSSYFDLVPNKLYWIPDFQEKHFPEFFSKQALRLKDIKRGRIAYSNKSLVLSSNNAKMDLDAYYPKNSADVSILPFAVTHPKYTHLCLKHLLEKYDLPQAYFFSPNQFYKHKNHIVILKAIKRLKEKYPNIVVDFSGKEMDSRNPEHVPMLKKYIRDNHLEANIRFLGFIDRSDQLKLMSEAMAIIQPSLFEGWSTVIEDAKSMNQVIIASDIDIHREQLKEKGFYFNPKDALDLADSIVYILENDIQRPNFQYKKRIQDFGSHFNSIIQKIAS